MQPRTMRWQGFAVTVAALAAALANLLFLPWGVTPSGIEQGYRIFDYVAASPHRFAELEPVARCYFDQAGLFLPFFVLSVALTAGARSAWGRFGGSALALFGVVLAGVLVGYRVIDQDEVRGDAAVRWLTVVTVGGAGAAVLVALVLRMVRRPLVYDAVTAAILLLLGLTHLYAVYALASFPDYEFMPTILAWSPGALYLLSAAGSIVTAVGAARRDRAPSPRRELSTVR